MLPLCGETRQEEFSIDVGKLLKVRNVVRSVGEIVLLATPPRKGIVIYC